MEKSNSTPPSKLKNKCQKSLCELKKKRLVFTLCFKMITFYNVFMSGIFYFQEVVGGKNRESISTWY